MLRRFSQYQTFDEPVDDFGSDDVFLQNVVASPPVAAPAPAPAPYTPPPIAAPAPAPYVAPQAFQPRFSLMPEQVYEDFGSDDSFLRDVVAPTPAPPPAWEPLAQQISSQWQQYGINPDIKGINRANELAQILTNYGITDLSKLGLTEATPYQETFEYAGSDIAPPESVVKDYTRRQITYGDKTLGKLGGFGSKGQQEFAAPLEYLGPAHEGSDRYGLAYSAAGKGWVDYEVVPGPGGKPVIVPRWGSTSDITPELLSVLAFAAAPFTGGLSTALAPVAGAAAPILSQALVSGTLSGLGAEAQGGSFGSGFGKGALTGGLTAGIGSLVAPAANAVGSSVLGATDSKLLADMASGAIKGGAGALPGAIMSGDFGNVLTGAVSGGVGSGVGSAIKDIIPADITGNVNVDKALLRGATDLATAATRAAISGQDLNVVNTLMPAVAQGISDEFKLPPNQVAAGLQVASKLLQGGDLSPTDIFRLGTSFASPTKATAGKEASAGYGGADTGDFFDSEEAQAVQDDIDSILARYPEAAPAPYFPEFEEPLLTAPPSTPSIRTAEPVTRIDPLQQLRLQTGLSPDNEGFYLEDLGDALHPTPTPISAPERSAFLEANIEEPETVQQLLEQYYPELFVPPPAPTEPPGVVEGPQTIEVTGKREVDFFPEFTQPLLTEEPIYEQPPTPAPEPVYEQPPTPAPAPAAPPAAAPAAPPAAAPAPAPAPKKQDDLALLMMLAAMMTPQQKEEEQYQLAQILGVDSPFGRIV